MEDFVKKNIERVNVRLPDLVRGVRMTNQAQSFSKYKIIDSSDSRGVEVPLDSIDFSHSIIFICDQDFLSYISYYGMLKMNNVVYPDNSQSGINSLIHTSYMIVESADIRFSKIPQDSFYDERRDIVLPESWNSINYVTKDICLWRLVVDVGIGDNDKMYAGCFSWIAERTRMGKIDWIFFIGTKEDFLKYYGQVSKLGLQQYQIKERQVADTNAGNTKKITLCESETIQRRNKAL